MVYLIFDKSANPTPTLARLDISVQVEKKNFLKGFYKFFKSSGRKEVFRIVFCTGHVRKRREWV